MSRLHPSAISCSSLVGPMKTWLRFHPVELPFPKMALEVTLPVIELESPATKTVERPQSCPQSQAFLRSKYAPGRAPHI